MKVDRAIMRLANNYLNNTDRSLITNEIVIFNGDSVI